MKALHVLPVQVPSFALLVKRMRTHLKEADIFEIWLDQMRVKGDIAVIRSYFKKPMLGKSDSLDMLKKAVKANLDYVDLPHDLKTDSDFETMAKIKKTILIRSYHDFEKTPSRGELLKILKQMKKDGAHLFKLATKNDTREDSDRLLSLLKEPEFQEKLILAGMGEDAQYLRLEAPLQGSVFYFAPIKAEQASAPGQLTKAELLHEWGSRV